MADSKIRKRHLFVQLFSGLILAAMMILMLPQSGNRAKADVKIKGIDVSRWQGVVDWAKVKADGVEFVMLGLGRYRNGQGMPDPTFETNIKGAQEQGIQVGVYLYSEARDADTAVKEAKYVLEQIDGYKISYPVAFDIEDEVHRVMTKKQRTDITVAFLEVIEKAGYYPMVYASESWLNYSLDLTRLAKYDKWVARWADSVSFSPISIWQYSSTGKVDGISANVDLDLAYKDYSKIITPRYHANGYAPTAPETEKPTEAEKPTETEKPAETEAPVIKAGWKKDKTGYWYQRSDGTKAPEGWLSVGKKKYYIGDKGCRVYGWRKVGEKYYYFKPDSGVMMTGWLTEGGKYYYLKKDGSRATGWIKVSGKKYYMNADGTKRFGWLNLNGKKFLLGTKTGALLTGWVKYQGKTFYFATQNGQMRKGWLTFGEKKYYVKSNGDRAAGWIRISGKWYYFNKKDGVMKRSCKVGRYVFGADGVCSNYK